MQKGLFCLPVVVVVFHFDQFYTAQKSLFLSVWVCVKPGFIYYY